MCAVDLVKDPAGVDKEHLVLTARPALAAVKKPQGYRESHRIEEVRAYRDDDLHCVGRDQLLADLEVSSACIRSRVRHDEASAPTGVQGRVERLDPDVI